MVVRRFIHVLTGIALLSVGIFFAIKTTHGVRDVLHREAAVNPAPKPDSRSEPDEVTEAARLKVYGPLAPPEDSPDPDGSPVRGRQASERISTLDHVHATPDGGPYVLVHSRIAIKSYRGFSFTVPPHALHPRLAGTFKTLNDASRDDSARVDAMLLNPKEFRDLLHQQGTASFFAAGPGGEVDWTLNPTFVDPQKYFLVFRNSSEKSLAQTVDVNFTLSFR